MTKEKWCPACSRFLQRSAFRLNALFRCARDCKGCEHGKRRRVGRPRRFDGVDIDAVHYKLGAIRL